MNLQKELSKIGYQARLAYDKCGIDICSKKDLEKRIVYIPDSDLLDKSDEERLKIILDKINAKH